MKHRWQLSRTLLQYPDALRRWDSAFQLLLRWSTSTEKETTHASSGLSSRLDPAPSSCAASEQQLQRLQAHLQAKSWSLPPENIFRDDGYSGAILRRPGLDRWRDQVAAAELDLILITDPDRLARNYVH